MTLIKTVNLTKKFGETIAVKGVNLEVEEGSFLTLLGASGSGKTTILMMIAGFQIPSSGKIYLEGENITKKPPHKRNIGLVFQNYALWPHMTVYENIKFPLRMHKFSEDICKDRIKNILKIVELKGFSDRYPKALSGGQQQRVALARSLIFNPKILLMDEPLGALDKKLREHMQFEIRRIQKELNITVIYVTHDQEEALTMSDYIILMKNGEIIQKGTPQELYDTPKNSYIATFLGESNIIKGFIEEKENKCYISGLDGGISFEISKGKTFQNAKDILFAVRPEKIKIHQQPQNNLTQCVQVKGRVKEKVYAGKVIKYRISVNAKTIIKVEIQSHAGQMEFDIGKDIFLVWNKKDINFIES
jgi:putative spermidine/putrescine transport system ATP-binding protein